MPARKKTGSRSGASGKNANNKIDQLLLEMSKNYTPPPPEVFAEVEDKWVLVKVRLMNWDNMGFQIRVRESTNLYTIEQKIRERHGGSVTGVSFWKDSVVPGNEVGNQPGDLKNTLKSIFRFNPQSGHYSRSSKNNSGPKINLQQEDDPEQVPLSSRSMEGKKKLNPFENVIIEECDYECSLFYDFVPFQSDCPLLRTSPRLADVVKDDDQYKKRKGGAVL